MAIQYLGVRGNVEKKMTRMCEHPAYKNRNEGTEAKYKCTLEWAHAGNHKYIINGKEVQIYGCCPQGQVANYEKN